MAEIERLICPGHELADAGTGVRFDILHEGRPAIGFAIRHQGQVYAYLDRCPHVPTELDWEPGRFFDAQGMHLICSNHGAVFLPDTGVCVGGPCKGRRLLRIAVEERGGGIYVRHA
jgi:nitrite reductase/ring-hydroxylating ferredoxin subunit